MFRRWASTAIRRNRLGGGKSGKISVTRSKLEARLGEITDSLDGLEYEPGAKAWLEKYEKTARLYESFLISSEEERRRHSDANRQKLDYWFRPRIREVDNWFGIVVAKRADHLQQNPTTSSTDSNNNNNSPAITTPSLTNTDVYRMWRAKGRPHANHGLPGY
eukprot:TRINITY_DN14704_c0_g1_i1.p1 TRINITY_DN14704_c0_g1~~TRINITY_DN14704_c0_g1_i1.p1  ORF type:complete len:184 (+),score=22.74 TRINITY_DN14704_c0_g1_i1:69-554(+)